MRLGRWIRLVHSIWCAPMLMMAAAVSAQAAELRFVHAVPGQGAAALEVGGEAGPAVGLGGVGDYRRVRDGRVELSVGDVSARETMREGRYTAVAWRPGGRRVVLTVFRDGGARAGGARLRVIHAAGELGEADVQLDGRALARALGPGEASDYASVDPGTYALRVTRPGGRGGPLAVRRGTTLAAGTASTAVVVGSGGRPTRVVLASDAVAAPSEGPATGLGGLDEGGTPWLAALAAALAAGLLGGVLFTLARRRGV